MFQFRRFPTYAYLIQRRLTEYCSAGFPHSEICGSMLMCSSPQLIAACHVLHRLLMPRHSPCALISLTSSGQAPYPSLPPSGESSLTSLPLLRDPNPLRWALARFWFSVMNYAIITEVQLGSIVLPISPEQPSGCPRLKFPQHCCYCPLLLASHTFFFIVQFSRCRPSGLNFC